MLIAIKNRGLCPYWIAIGCSTSPTSLLIRWNLRHLVRLRPFQLSCARPTLPFSSLGDSVCGVGDIPWCASCARVT